MTKSRYPVDDVLRAFGVRPPEYTTGEVARIFGKTNQWLRYIMDNDRYVDARNGERIKPSRVDGNRFVWSGEDVIALAVACFHNRTISRTKLETITRRVLRDGGGTDAPDRPQTPEAPTT